MTVPPRSWVLLAAIVVARFAWVDVPGTPTVPWSVDGAADTALV
jgi:hypothetical protein